MVEYSNIFLAGKPCLAGLPSCRRTQQKKDYQNKTLKFVTSSVHTLMDHHYQRTHEIVIYDRQYCQPVELPVGLQLNNNQLATIISVYTPTLNADEDTKERTVDFNARIRRDSKL